MLEAVPAVDEMTQLTIQLGLRRLGLLHVIVRETFVVIEKWLGKW